MYLQTHLSPARPPPFDVVVVGGSLGGVAALIQLTSGLPSNFAVPLVIVQHRSNQLPYLFDKVLRRETTLDVVNAEEGGDLHAGVIYLAKPGRHLLIDAGRHFKTTETSRVNFVRPSIDVLFKSAAHVFKNRVLAVILTGRGKDGAAGVHAIKQAGGTIIVQNKATSLAFDMPFAAIQTKQVDFVLPLDTIGPAMITLAMVEGAATLFHVAVFSSIYLTEAKA